MTLIGVLQTLQQLLQDQPRAAGTVPVVVEVLEEKVSAARAVETRRQISPYAPIATRGATTSKIDGKCALTVAPGSILLQIDHRVAVDGPFAAVDLAQVASCRLGIRTTTLLLQQTTLVSVSSLQQFCTAETAAECCACWMLRVRQHSNHLCVSLMAISLR